MLPITFPSPLSRPPTCPTSRSTAPPSANAAPNSPLTLIATPENPPHRDPIARRLKGRDEGGIGSDQVRMTPQKQQFPPKKPRFSTP